LSIIFDTSDLMAHLWWYSENIKLILKEKNQKKIQRPKLSKNVHFGAVAHMFKK